MIDSTNKDTGAIEPDLEVQSDPDTGDRKLLRTRADIYNYFVLPIMREITVNKAWEHGGNPPDSWPASTTITVYDPDNPTVFDSRAYRSIESWAASFELPKYDPLTGKLIDYQIKEELPPDYIITDVTQKEDVFTITNTYAPGIVRPAVQKWVDGKPPEQGRFSFELKALTPNAPLPESTTISVVGEGTGFWGDLKFEPINQEETRTYRYEIRELPGGTAGYTYDPTVYTMTVKAVEKGGKVTVTTQYETQEGIAAYAPLSFQNVYQKAELADLTVTKTVRGTGADRTKAFQFTVHIDGKAPITFTLKHGERKTISDIPVGTRYTVTEGNYYAQGYTTDAINSDGTIPKEGITASFTNSKDALPGVGYLTVRKEVAGSGGETDRLFRFVVKIGSKPSQVVFLKAGQEKTFGPYSAGTSYRVTEEDYTQLGYETTSTGASGQIRTRESVAVFTNTRQADNRGWLSVAKTVIGEGGDPEQKFNFVVTIDGKTHTLALADGESHVFTDLPVGAAYRVEEENYASQGYITFSDGSAGILLAGGNQATFTNQKGEVPPDAVGNLTVTKTVTGRFMDLTKRFRFTILVGDQVHTVALRHGEHAVLENIPLGTSYSVREENYSAEGYITRSTGATGTISAEGATAAFVNAYHSDAPPQPGQDAVQVSGQKTWIHGTNKPANYPRSITVYVMNGSTIVARKTVTEADGWRYAFNLPKYDEQGAEILYSVSEETVKSYVKSISGYDILNTYTVGSPQTGDSNRMWVWLLLLAVGAAGLRSAVFYRKKGSR